MKPEQFAYWLQGFVELNRGAAPDAAQWKSICEHLSTVFEKVTPAVAPGPIIASPATPGNDPRNAAQGPVVIDGPIRDLSPPGSPSLNEAIRRLQELPRMPSGPGLLGDGITITC